MYFASQNTRQPRITSPGPQLPGEVSWVEGVSGPTCCWVLVGYRLSVTFIADNSVVVTWTPHNVRSPSMGTDERALRLVASCCNTSCRIGSGALGHCSHFEGYPCTSSQCPTTVSGVPLCHHNVSGGSPPIFWTDSPSHCSNVHLPSEVYT